MLDETTQDYSKFLEIDLAKKVSSTFSKYTMQHNNLVCEVSNGVRTIRLNKPKAKNAIDATMFQFMADLLNKDANNEDVAITIITGTGEYFTSGFDISTQAAEVMKDPETKIKEGTDKFKSFITALINYPKLIIAVVNGPAVGVGVTMLPLCDIVYASETATFRTPFTKLGLCPEGASSYLFPKIFGRSLASEMLLLGRIINAQEALKAGLVSKVVPTTKLPELYKEITEHTKIPMNTIRINKGLMVNDLRETLHKVNDKECLVLLDAFASEEFAMSMMAFMQRKSKL